MLLQKKNLGQHFKIGYSHRFFYRLCKMLDDGLLTEDSSEWRAAMTIFSKIEEVFRLEGNIVIGPYENNIISLMQEGFPPSPVELSAQQKWNLKE